MPLSADYLNSRARRYRHLAGKARTLAEQAPDDPVAPRLRELAVRLTLDAERDEREALELGADEGGVAG